MAKNWWKAVAVILVLFALIGGLLIDVPRLPILNETIRNLFYHVTMWFAMMILMTASVVYSIKYLRSGKELDDAKAKIAAEIGLFLGVLGIATGSIWAKFTWGAYWINDPKLNGAAVTILAYFAYMILRNSFDDEEKRAKISAVYNIFAYVLLIVFLMILPRMTDSLHPGNGGNPAFSQYDLDNTMRIIFYPAIIGWTLIGVWLGELKLRLHKLRIKKLEDEL
ncbi:cytochrome c biogenesis protein CcsA [Salibacter halophilus]|uniref:ABC transporter permease n=1 Tax=Salibacter halophilus TaxID=1803916 RepID=A0A6N6M7C5_9FLAO|nr:cytochrome c biogenesis protein CcsA [Salibacter halophilus]KAB1065960.1 ABC transporter permease [Salibacter halophilus]